MHKAIVDTLRILLQGIMGACLHDPTLLQHNDPVSLFDSRQTVGNCDGGPVPRDSVQGGLNDPLASHIDGAGSFVEDEDFGLANNAACNSYALALAARKLGACIANLSVIPLVTS